jgi:hypothetical protein
MRAMYPFAMIGQGAERRAAGDTKTNVLKKCQLQAGMIQAHLADSAVERKLDEDLGLDWMALGLKRPRF